MRKLQIKFPSQIRISGWDFGSSARAMNQAGGKDSLMTYESVSKTQADLRKGRISTTERKSMSTKTTIKRIALVAVSALGFGMLTGVAANATDATVNEVTAVSITTPSVGRVGSPLATALGFTAAASSAADGQIDDGDEVTLAGVFVSRPAGSTATIIFDNTGLAVAGITNETAVFTAASGFMPSKLVVDGSGAAITAGAQVAGRVGFVPDVAGDYSIKVWHDANGNGAQDATEAVSSTTTFTVGAAPSTVTVTKYGSTTCEDGSYGALVKLSLPTGQGLALGESIRVTPSTSTADITEVNGTNLGSYTPGTTTYYDLTSTDFVGGVAYINVTDSEAGTLTLSLAGQGSSIASLIGSTTVSFKTCQTGDTGTTVIQGSTAGAEFTSVTDGINGTSTTATIPLAAKTITYYSAFTAGATAGQYFKATVTDSNGRVTGSATQSLTGLQYDIAYVGAANATTATTIEGTFSVTLTPAASGDGFNVTTANGTSLVSGVTTAGVDTSAGTVTVSPSAALTLKVGGTITYNVTVKDKWARAIPNASVKMVITGRNANQTVTPPTTTTNASGVASFTLTDAPLAGTTSLSDSIVFTAVGADANSKASSAVTITWSATGAVASTVTILGGNNSTTTGVAASTPSYKDISAGDGAEEGAVTATATVKDASGNLLTGVPVTFTVSGTGAAITSTSKTVYTGAAGTATAYVYAWVEGNYTVTATSGAASGTAVYSFRQSAAGEERTISATTSNGVVTAKAVDRFGNAVPNVTIYATQAGGVTINGKTRDSGTTDATGQVDFIVTGAGSVTVSTISWASAPGTKGSGQTSSLKGYSDSATTPTAFTAYTAGTALVDEEGVGASFDAAGVASASVDVASTTTSDSVDAANEATDAANAATDAANAAAEAADAATAAAQDAQAAVAALATQVASLIAGIKAQITTLTNLVIKIQKKVRA
jgi:hypothetical protein